MENSIKVVLDIHWLYEQKEVSMFAAHTGSFNCVIKCSALVLSIESSHLDKTEEVCLKTFST